VWRWLGGPFADGAADNRLLRQPADPILGATPIGPVLHTGCFGGTSPPGSSPAHPLPGACAPPPVGWFRRPGVALAAEKSDDHHRLRVKAGLHPGCPGESPRSLAGRAGIEPATSRPQRLHWLWSNRCTPVRPVHHRLANPRWAGVANVSPRHWRPPVLQPRRLGCFTVTP